MIFLGLAVVFGLLVVFGTGMALLYLSGWVSVKSTPEHLIISRRKTNRYDPPAPERPGVSWPRVRSMELACLGEHYHRLDGSTRALGMEPVGEELPSEAASYRENDGSLVYVVTDEMLEREREVAAARAGTIHHGWPPDGRYSDHDRQVANTRAGRPADQDMILQAIPEVPLSSARIADMTLDEFAQFRRQFCAKGDRVHRGMFG